MRDSVMFAWLSMQSMQRVPPDTAIPESTRLGSVDEEHRDTVIADRREDRAILVGDGVMRFDLRIGLITARLPRSDAKIAVALCPATGRHPSGC